MATDLTTIFGNELKVGVHPRKSERQYTGFPGAHGLVGMHLGSRGRQIIVAARLAGSGATYNTARAACQALVDAIEAYQWLDADDYSYAGSTYYNVVFDSITLIADQSGKYYHLTSEGYVTCDIIAYLIEMI